MDRWIVHWDGDAFFASVEQAADRRLRNRPIAVGGGERGIIASASYEARRFGIHAAMPTRQALSLCPNLVLIRGHYELYEQFSRQIFDLCEDLTPWVERASIDEGYLDCTPLGSPDSVVRSIRKLGDDIKGWLKVSVSQGIASNRLVSAVASKIRKPGGFTVVPHGAEASFMSGLPIEVLPGIGPRTAVPLKELGLRVLGDLLALPAGNLGVFFGNRTSDILSRARGEDSSLVEPSPPEAKSLSHQETFENDSENRSEIVQCLKGHLEDLLKQLRSEQKMARTITVSLRYSDWEEASGQYSLTEPGQLAEEFFPLIERLVSKLWVRRVRLRMVSVKLSALYPSICQPDLFQPKKERLHRLSLVADQLQAAYGPKALRRACFCAPGN